MSDRRTAVVTHGAWSAGWVWKKKRARLALHGIDLWTPTYTGVGERSHLAHEGITLETWQDDSSYLRSRLDLLYRNGRAGLVLVFFILALFLRFRLAIWVTFGIPVSFLGTIWLMPTMDVSISLISLFAFIVVLGIVVDDAIVLGENIYTHQHRHGPGLKSTVSGALEVARPVESKTGRRA